MPPCQPASPVPASTAATRPVTCSGVIVDMVMHCRIRSTPAISSGSAYGAGESSTRTVKSCSFRNGMNRSVAATGSCPSHPPRTTSA
jgi:hypothetical protein